LDSDTDLLSGLSSSFGGSDTASEFSQNDESDHSSLSEMSSLDVESDADVLCWQDVTESGWDTESASGGSDGDDEESLDDDKDGDDIFPRPGLQSWIQRELNEMYAKQYKAPCEELPRGPSFLQFVLDKYKTLQPDQFHQGLHVMPSTFDRILEKISDHPVFFNNSNNPQNPVEVQLAVTLYHFSHYGNAASLERVRKWAGVGKGSVTKMTRRVMTALLNSDFIKETVRMPTEEEKEEAKIWIEEHSCKYWRNGWLFVDGTLISLYIPPYWYGESYFDRKCNYSLNVQVSYLSILSKSFFYNFTCCRLCQCQIFASLTSATVIQAAPTMLRLGRGLGLLRSTRVY
jgi:hypothetical protein